MTAAGNKRLDSLTQYGWFYIPELVPMSQRSFFSSSENSNPLQNITKLFRTRIPMDHVWGVSHPFAGLALLLHSRCFCSHIEPISFMLPSPVFSFHSNHISFDVLSRNMAGAMQRRQKYTLEVLFISFTSWQAALQSSVQSPCYRTEQGRKCQSCHVHSPVLWLLLLSATLFPELLHA